MAGREGGGLKPAWFQILLSVADGPKHGSAIMEEVLARTEGGVRLWPGALYGSLAELSDRGWIREAAAPEDAPTEGGRRRFWRITARGRRVLSEEASRLAAYVRVAQEKRVLRSVEP
ncbi:MAG: PadR family transcriptional regulator [Gemmatimonadetes bacterium]|nr:PadR family transcriptional regulator [Gemmatimonadota bacterium]